MTVVALTGRDGGDMASLLGQDDLQDFASPPPLRLAYRKFICWLFTAYVTSLMNSCLAAPKRLSASKFLSVFFLPACFIYNYA